MSAPLSSLLFPDRGAELDHRRRLIEAMAECVRGGSYAALTIADVVRRAHVSKRTFYEHFADKEACYLAAYAAVNDTIMLRIARAMGKPGNPAERLRRVIGVYLATLDEYPALSRSFLSEIQAVGPAALAARRDAHRRYAQLVRALIDQGRANVPGARALTPAMATAVVGGINELLLETLESGEASLSSLEPTVFELVGSVVLAPAELEGGMADWPFELPE